MSFNLNTLRFTLAIIIVITNRYTYLSFLGSYRCIFEIDYIDY